MQGGERSHREVQDPSSASHQVFGQRPQPLTFPNQKSLGRNSTPSKDGSTPLPRTNLLASQIFSRPSTTSQMRRRHHRVTTLAATGTLATARVGHKRNHNRQHRSTQATPARSLDLNLHCHPVQTLVAHLVARTALSARAWRERRIAADAGGMSQLPLGLQSTIRNGSSNAHSAQIHSNRNMTGLGTKNHFIYLWKSGSAHRSGL